jgi:SAM-dependent methyltransferase
LDGPLDALACARHGSLGGRSTDGIFVFDRSDTYWGEVPRDAMRRIAAAARADGWQAALERELRPRHAHLYDYVQHVSRGDWQVLLPLDRERSIAVDVGAGWGANSVALAPRVRRVYAVEKIAERIEFLALRAQQEAVANLVPVRADLHALPFAPGSIDVFAVNGVLEWVGLVDPDAGPGRRPADPGRLQERFLGSLLQLLKPGGWLYVGIENRFGRAFLRGLPDHQGLRWTSLMPRPVARAYTWMRAAASPRTYVHERDYRAWTYSYAGYVRLLEACGFRDVQRFAVVPGYNEPAQIVDLDAPGPLLWLAGRGPSARPRRAAVRRRLRRTLVRLGIEARIASSYALIARRPGGEP